MRIIHSCLRYPPATGGVETYVKELVTHTRDISANRDVRVLTSKLRTHGPISELDPNFLLDDPPYVQRLHHATTPFISYPRLQSLSYYIGHHKPDILHGYSFWYQPADVTARFAKQNKIPFIFHPIYYTNSIRRKPIWRLYQSTIGRKTFAAADVVVVISPFEKELIKKTNMPVKRFELIPPGVNFDEFTETNPNPFLSRNILGTVLLTVSRIAKGKGLTDLINALPKILKAIPDTQLAIAGEDFGHLDNLKQLAHKLGVTNHVHFLGRLDRQTLVSCYQHANLFIHPSHYEAFGIVLAEALAANTPVVARNSSAIPYVAPHDKASLLFNSKPELIKNVIEILQNDFLRQKLVSGGSKYVKQNFSWEAAEKKLASLYKEIDH